MGKHVLIYDGECVLCDSTVRWLAERDEHRQIVFASRASR
jgi:predicted DCC family thiol-disulfide oxidoreductase YuxK